MTDETWPHPLANADTAPYWAGIEAGELRFPRCKACGHRHFPPRRLCPRCWGTELEWSASAGAGCVHSVTVVRRAAVPTFEVPYVLALVDLDDAPRMMANIVGADAHGATIGDRVAVTFQRRGDTTLPQFRLVSNSPQPREGLR